MKGMQKMKVWVWWPMSLIPALRMQKHMECHELEVSQGHTNPRLIWATVGDPVSSKQTKRKEGKGK